MPPQEPVPADSRPHEIRANLIEAALQAARNPAAAKAKRKGKRPVAAPQIAEPIQTRPAVFSPPPKPSAPMTAQEARKQLDIALEDAPKQRAEFVIPIAAGKELKLGYDVAEVVIGDTYISMFCRVGQAELSLPFGMELDLTLDSIHYSIMAADVMIKTKDSTWLQLIVLRRAPTDQE